MMPPTAAGGFACSWWPWRPSTRTNDSQKRYSITFVVVTGPARDRLLLKEDQHLVDVVNFTKAQVDERLLLYEQTRPYTDLGAKDMFSFDVVTPFATPLTK